MEQGKLIKKFEKRTGESAKGAWSAMDILVEHCNSTSNGEYRYNVVYSTFGDATSEVENIPEGTMIKFFSNIQAREYNGRWYNNVSARLISPVGQSQSVGQSMQPRVDISTANDSEDLPF